jgi:heme ABC exporter ATP-binding subunit CcmA
MAPAVRLSRAVVLLGRFPALAGADLLVERGEIVHLSGPNGAGKSTLLRACAGLLRVVEGEAEVLGHDLHRDRRRIRRAVGLLGHSSFLYEELTVLDNLRFAVRAAGAPVAAVAPALERLGLAGRLADVQVARLSAGQRRRAALAVLVARSPELWLLDEPHAGLDAAGRDLVDGLVREAAAAGTTVVFASHELDRASGLAQRQLTVVGGQVHETQPFASPQLVGTGAV